MIFTKLVLSDSTEIDLVCLTTKLSTPDFI